MDRRSVLTCLSALGLAACAPAAAPVEQDAAAPESLDLSALEARHGGRLGFALHDTGSDRRLAWRGEERFVYCSTFKMYLAAATLLRVQAGEERLDRQILVTGADMLPTAPVTEPAVGRSLTIQRLCQGTVETSDNPAANILIRELGGLDAVRAFYRSIGDESTRVDRLEMELNRLDGDKDTITPEQSVADMHRLFIDREGPLTDVHRDLLLGWMIASIPGQNRLKGGVSSGWTVAHKTGTGGYGPTNDIGVLYPPSGAPIVVAAYFHGPETTSDAQNAAVVADAVRAALASLGHTA